MAFPELFDWYDVAIRDNKAERREIESAQKKAQEQSKRRTR